MSINDKDVDLIKKINNPWEIEQQFFDCREILYETSSLFFDENLHFKILNKDGLLVDSFNSNRMDSIGDVIGDDNFGYEDIVVDPKWTDKFNNTLLLIHELIIFCAPNMFVFIHSIGLYSAAGTCLSAAAWTTRFIPFIAMSNLSSSRTSPMKKRILLFFTSFGFDFFKSSNI